MGWGGWAGCPSIFWIRDEDKVDDYDSADELSLSMLALKRAGENKTGKKRQFEKSYDDNGEIGIV